MNGYPTPGGAPAYTVPPYTERDVTALLDAQGGRLYSYFWPMLGDDTAVTRALAGTIIAALPHLAHRELYSIARMVCRKYRPTPAMPYARAEANTLAAATKAALRRLAPEDREICVLGAPAYGLNDADLGAVFGTWEVEDLLSRPMNAFSRALAACAADAGLEQDEELVTRAWRLVGTGQVPLPYDEIVSLATDPAAEGLRHEIRRAVTAASQPAAATQHAATQHAMTQHAAAAQGGLELLGTGSHRSVTVHGMPDSEHLTVPMPRGPRRSGQHGSHRRRGAVAGTVLAAGALPVAFAMVMSGHFAQPPASQHVVSPPLSAAAPGTQVSSGSHVRAGGPADKPGTYRGRHTRSAAQRAAATSAGTGTSGTSAGTQSTGSAGSTGTMGTGTTTGTTTTGTTTGTGTGTYVPPTTTQPTTPPYVNVPPTTPPTTAPTPPPPVVVTPTPTPTSTGHGNGNGGGNNGGGNG